MAKNQGLSTQEAKKRLLEHGANQIFKPAKLSFFGIARHEVTEPMILLLIFVGIVYSFWGNLEDAATIFAVIFLLVLAEVYNEYRAKKAISSLARIAAPKTRVRRDGKIVEIDSEEVAVGDILILTPGTKVAADARLAESIGIQVDESALTGESYPQEKKEGEDVYAGTTIDSGEGEALVVTTGGSTRIGKIAATAKEVKPPRTPLQLAMKSLTGKLVYAALFFSIAIPVIGILRGQDLRVMILTGLSLSFAVIPEELPIVITMVLGLGSYTLSKKNFLVKKIKAAETLGNATVIVTDKTGTITSGRMEIAFTYPGDGKEVLRKASSSLSEYPLTPLDREIESKAKELGLHQGNSGIYRQRSLGNSRKTRTVIRKGREGYELFMSGAPEEVLASCRKSKDVKDAVKQLDEQTAKGRRVIAIAYRKLGKNEENLEFKKLEKELAFAGLVGFEDSPREGVKETIARVAKAGVRTIMVTGDHPLTAKFIAEEVGITTRDSRVVTGAELDSMTDVSLQNAVKEVSVFARTSPQHKYRIVKALQNNGEVVAVTGDGVNDALALKGADIGIAMGIRGTDVAKEAAEVVLADDNYVTIARGLFEGRKFFDNLRKGIKYYLSVKVALILIFLLPALLGIPMPFSPIQIILLELFMDLAASAGFVSEPEESNIYTRPPKSRKEEVLDRQAITDVLTKGVVLFTAVMSVYFYARYSSLPLAQTQTYAFSAWIVGHIVLAFISRSDKESIVSLGLFSNKVINIWSLAAIAFLLTTVYVPFFHDKINLTAINPAYFAGIAITTGLIVGSLELRKMLQVS
jgi:Ca2+-transporting ATPase